MIPRCQPRVSCVVPKLQAPAGTRHRQVSSQATNPLACHTHWFVPCPALEPAKPFILRKYCFPRLRWLNFANPLKIKTFRELVKVSDYGYLLLALWLIRVCPYVLFIMLLKHFDRVGKLAIGRRFQLCIAYGPREITRTGENLQLSTCRPANIYTQIYIRDWDMQLFTTLTEVPTFFFPPLLPCVSSHGSDSCEPVQKLTKRKQKLISGGWIRDLQPKSLCLAQYFCFAFWVIICTCSQWAKQPWPLLGRIWPCQCRGPCWVSMLRGQWYSILSHEDVNVCTRRQVKGFALGFSMGEEQRY